jgi:hypothetical protein
MIFFAKMDGRRHERRHHFRGRVRPGRVMPVRYKTAARADWVSAETRDIGVGGAFIATLRAEAIGTTLTVEIRLPTSEQTFTLPAVVRWAAADGGMGVQFVGVDVDVLLELNDYFATLTS